MSKLRFDPVQRRWVVISTERARKPADFFVEQEEVRLAFSPFAEGNESRTPPEVYAVREPGHPPNGPGWKVRVVPNKYPILGIEGDLSKRREDLYDEMDGVGVHEVVIETPDPSLSTPDLPEAQVALVVEACRARLLDLRRDLRLRYLLVFKNSGSAAGSAIGHAHTQIIGLPVTPITVRQELESSADHFARHGRCLFCDVLRREQKDRARIVEERDDFLAYAPFASRFPFEVFIAPLRHSHDFGEITDREAAGFGGILRSVLRRLRGTLRDPPYNFVLHTCPNTLALPRPEGYWRTLAQDFHWHLEVIPRVTNLAGFEWGTGFYVNPMLPEEAARFLRETA